MANDDENRPRGRRDRGELQRALLRSGRVGWHGGWMTRTFHAHWRGVLIGRPGGKGGTVDYVAREGDYSDRDDLEYLAGDPAAFRETMAAIEATARVRSGPTAERLAVAGVIELPADSTPEQRRAFAEARLAYWSSIGRSAIVAVHDEPGNPHIHELVAARPVLHRSPTGHLVADRRPGTRLLVGKAAVQAARRAAAEMVNGVFTPYARFFAGRDALMDEPGIVGRQPERRLPRAVRHGRRPDDREAVARVREAKAERRQRAAAEKPLIVGRRKDAALARAEKAGIFVHRNDDRDSTPVMLISRHRFAQERQEGIRQGKAMAKSPAPLPELTEAQVDLVTGTHARLGLDLEPAWSETEEGRRVAFAAVRAAQAAEKRGLDAVRPALTPEEARPPKATPGPKNPAPKGDRGGRGM